MLIKRTLSLFSLFTILCFSIAQAAESPLTTRAAFDLGSGKFKMVVAEVDEQRIYALFSKMIDVKLAEDFVISDDGNLSEKIQQEALSALQELKRDAQNFGACQFSGITTAVFRKAKNGPQLLEHLQQETGVTLLLVSQEKEGALGFNTAVVLSPDLNEDEIVSWDSGNGSFQLTQKEKSCYTVYEGPLGDILVIKAFLEEVRHQPYSNETLLNPISLAEADMLSEIIEQRIILPKWLKEKLANKSTQVIAIGDNESIFAVARTELGKPEFTQEQVQKLIEKLTGSTNEELGSLHSTPESVITRLVLLHTVMKKFGVETVIYKESAGSILGLFIDTDLWK